MRDDSTDRRSRVSDQQRGIVCLEVARVTHLPTGFRVEWRSIENDFTLLSLAQMVYFRAIADDGCDSGTGQSG